MQSTSPRLGHYNFSYARYLGNDLPKFKEFRLENPQLTHARGESPTLAVRYGSSILACVAGVKRGRGDLDARGRKERKACKETIFSSKLPLICYANIS